MEVEVMGRGGRKVEREGEGREGQNRQTSKWNDVFRTGTKVRQAQNIMRHGR